VDIVGRFADEAKARRDAAMAKKDRAFDHVRQTGGREPLPRDLQGAFDERSQKALDDYADAARRGKPIQGIGGAVLQDSDKLPDSVLVRDDLHAKRARMSDRDYKILRNKQDEIWRRLADPEDLLRAPADSRNSLDYLLRENWPERGWVFPRYAEQREEFSDLVQRQIAALEEAKGAALKPGEMQKVIEVLNTGPGFIAAAFGVISAEEAEVDGASADDTLTGASGDDVIDGEIGETEGRDGATASDEPEIQLAGRPPEETDHEIGENDTPPAVAAIILYAPSGPDYAMSLENTFALGAGLTASGIPKSLALAGAAIRNELLGALENALRGEEEEDAVRDRLMDWAEDAFGGETAALVEAYFDSEKGARGELIRVLRGLPDNPEDMEIYKAGVQFDEWMRENFPVSDEYGDDFMHNVMNSLGSAMPLMVAAIVTGGASITGAAAAAAVGAAMGASDTFQQELNDGETWQDALDKSGIAAAYHLVDAAPIARILGRIGGEGSTIIQDMAGAGLDNLFKDAFINVLDKIMELDNVRYDEEKGIISFSDDKGAASFTVGSLFAMLTAMALGN
jgi:hypothetical protein